MTEEPKSKCRLEGICYYCQDWGVCIVDSGASCNWDTRSRQHQPAEPCEEYKKTITCRLKKETSCEQCKQHDAAIRKEGYEQGRKDAKKEHRTYESCHRHFACPDGEECWYASENYYWDCGRGAAKLSEEYARGKKDEREKVLKEQNLECWGHYQMNSKQCLKCSIAEACYTKRECDEESLRSTTEKERAP